MRPPRTSPRPSDAIARGTAVRAGAAGATGLSGESGEAALSSDASVARHGDDGSDRPTTAAKLPHAGDEEGISAPPSGKQIVRDHARLAERLADNIGRLRQAHLDHDDTREVRDRLEAFLVEDLIPYLQAEESALREIAGPRRWTGRWVSRAQRRLHQRLHEHHRVIDAAHEMQRADTTVLALVRAEDVRALLFAHLVGEDRELVTVTQAAAADEDSDNIAISAELDELLVHDHARIAAAITVARDAAADGSDDELDACDRAVAALSQHAAVMSTRAYPMIPGPRSGPDRAATRALTDDLRRAERAMRHLNRLLRGAAGGDPSFDNRDRLWNDVEESWQHHVAGEEPLIRRAAPLLGPERVLSLITLLRRPVGHSLTRPHPQLLRGGWPTGLAIRAQYRFDRWRDDLDNRGT